MHQSLVSTQEKSREFALPVTNLKLVQVCPSIHLECGVGNFARNCDAALAKSGIDVTTLTEIPADVTTDLLIQHEYALFDTPALRSRLAQHRGRVFFFAHCPGADLVFGKHVDAFVTLCEGMTETATRTLVLPHPGWQRVPLLNRDELKARFQWSPYRCVVGTNGFISPSRQFDEVARRLLPFAERENMLVQVIGTRHHSHDARPGYRDQELRLRELAAAYHRHFALETRFLDHEELNHRLQACDLTWCWTATPSRPYGSGTCADQYGSGTRLIVADKRQHGHVSSLPNVVLAPDDMEGFVRTLEAEMSRSEFPRHDPSLLSWDTFAERLVRYIAESPRSPSPPSHDNGQAIAVVPPPPKKPLQPHAAPLTIHSAAPAAEAYLQTIEPYPARFSGQGIVICAGGVRYLTCAWVLIRTLRRLGCMLPIDVWSYPREVDPHWCDLAKAYDVVVRTIPEESPAANPRWAGWRLKPAAILRSSFREVLYLDADNLPVRDPTELFTWPEYRAAGTVFWPDRTKAQRGSDQWSVFGVPFRDEFEIESGQILLDKAVAWKALNLCDWYNKHAEFFYRYCYGDKDTFRFAWRKTGTSYMLPTQPVVEHPRYLLQHDLRGRLLFQHRHGDKWNLAGNRRLPGFIREEQCIADVAELRGLWRHDVRTIDRSVPDQRLFETLADTRYRLVRVGRAAWDLTLGASGRITTGWSADIAVWNVRDEKLLLGPGDEESGYRLTRRNDGVWEGCAMTPKLGTILLIPKS